MPTLRLVSLCFVALAVVTPSANAQKYRASNTNPHGEQLVAAFVSSSTCIGGQAAGLAEAIDAIKVALDARAARSGQQFRALGVATDWSPTVGLSYLAQFGNFDELHVGGNWFGLGPQQLLWADTAVRASIPQILVYKQRVESTGPRVSFSPRVVIRQIAGPDSIIAWAKAGAPLP
ncbi:MAG TPA: hypothetical protein VF493_15875 [Terriglobales bacterium]